MPKITKPLPLPDVLLGEAPSVKLLYLWLAQHVEVDMSQRDIAASLGITQANVSLATRRLIELGLATRDPGHKPRERAMIRALTRREDAN